MNSIVTSSAVFLLLLLLVSAFPTATQACKCLMPGLEKLFDDTTNVDHVYILGQAKMKNGYFDGWVNPTEVGVDMTSNNRDIYYLAYQHRSHKGCKGRRGQFVFYTTASSSAACGVTLSPGWYLLGSATDYDRPKYKRVGSCGLIKKYSELTYKEKKYVKDNTEICD